MKSKFPLIVVGGPTASGKTSLAIEIANEVNGVLVNADSVQVYKGFDIGSNKGNLDFIKAEKIKGESESIDVYNIEDSGIYGYLFNLVFPDSEFNLFKYQQIARNVIRHIQTNRKVPILVGGTGLYIDAIIRNYEIKEQKPDPKLRKRLEVLPVELLRKLLPDYTLRKLNNSDINNPYRLIRAIEKEESSIPQKLDFDKTEFINHLFVYPKYTREELFEKINLRVIEMFKSGFVKEVERILEKYPRSIHPLTSSGYKQVVEMLSNPEELSEIECMKLVQTSHRKYAKRQITWFENPNRGYKLVHTSNWDDVKESL